MNALVIGGTGTVGTQVVGSLAARGVTARAMSRQTREGAVYGDLQKPETLGAAMTGFDAVFLATALAPDETNQGLAAVEAAKSAGVRRFVYMSVQDVDGGRHIPHFASKLPIEHAVRRSSMEWTILQPNNFFQNDLQLRDAITGPGVYPFPISARGVSRVDTRDIAEAAAIALTTDAAIGEAVVVAGPQALTGPDVAAAYAERLGRPVHYVGQDIGAWAAGMAQFLPPWMVIDVRIMLEYFDERGLVANAGQIERLTKLLGRPPRSFAAFVGENF